MKILLVQIRSKNLGDCVIADNTRALLQQYECDVLDYAIHTEDLAQIRYVDAVIFAGGGLIKFQHEKLYRQVSEIIMEAEKYHVPVYLNAVGVEGFDPDDERCRMLMEALNLPCVKAISVRDNMECLKQNYITNPSIRLRKVFDPAIWSATTYHIEKEKAKGQKCIGLGIGRDNLFVMYGAPEIDREFLLDMWKAIAEKLEEKGYRWKIFTNGLDQDERFAEEVLEAIGHGEKAKQPMLAEELVKEIAGMDGMIACRMHANIIAYALGIPSVGLAWNEKLLFWGRKCGYPERCISPEQMTPDHIVETLERALAKKTRRPSAVRRMGTYWELRHFIKRECTERPKEKTKVKIAEHLVAPALGGYDYLYKNLNSIPQMWSAAESGYRYLELDVRMTKDQQLACVNGWNWATAKALGWTMKDCQMTMDEFLNQSYYGRFPTCSFEEAVSAFMEVREKYPKIKLILDVGKPKASLLESVYGQIVAILRKHEVSDKSVIFKIQRERDVKVFRELDYPSQIAYLLSADVIESEEGGEEYRKVLAFCRKKKIHMITLSEKTWSPQLQEDLTRQGFQTLILSYTKVGDVLQALDAGADLVASHFYDVSYMKRLLF